MATWLKIDDGTIPWLSPAIHVFTYNSIGQKIKVVSDDLEGEKDYYFTVYVENTTKANLSNCTSGLFKSVSAISKDPPLNDNLSPRGRFRIIEDPVPGSPPSRKFTLIDNFGVGKPREFGVATDVPFTWIWATNGITDTAVLISYRQPATAADRQVVGYSPNPNAMEGWNLFGKTITEPNDADIRAGFSSDGLTFLQYKFKSNNAELYRLYNVIDGLEFLDLNVPIGINTGDFYFSPGGDILAWIPNQIKPNAANNKVIFYELFGGKAPTLGSNITSLPAWNVRQDTLPNQNLEVRVKGGNAALEVLQPGLASTMGAGIKLTDAEVQNSPLKDKITYACMKGGLVTVEVQVQPTTTFNTNKPMPDAWAYVDIPKGPSPQPAECLQAWRSPKKDSNNDQNNHHCLIAEAFVPGALPPNSRSILPFLIATDHDNIAQLNLLILHGSEAKVTFLAQNPLDDDAEVALVMVKGPNLREQFTNLPALEPIVPRKGLRRLDSGDALNDKLAFPLAANSSAEIEFIAEVDEVSDKPSAVIYSVVQKLRGISVGAITIIVLHGDVTLSPHPAQPSSVPLCPLEFEKPVIMTDGLAGSHLAPMISFYSEFQDNHVGAFFHCPSTDLQDVSVYVESTGHPLLKVEGKQIGVGDLPKGHSFYSDWEVDCSDVPAGKYLVSFVVQATGYNRQRLYGEVRVHYGVPSMETPFWFDTAPENHPLDKYLAENFPELRSLSE